MVCGLLSTNAYEWINFIRIHTIFYCAYWFVFVAAHIRVTRVSAFHNLPKFICYNLWRSISILFCEQHTCTNKMNIKQIPCASRMNSTNKEVKIKKKQTNCIFRANFCVIRNDSDCNIFRLFIWLLLRFRSLKEYF